MGDLPEHVAANRAFWDDMADQWVVSGERSWSAEEPSWGIWGTPEAEVEMLPTSMEGLDAIELGCGTAYVSAWMTRRGARVFGIDNSEEQLRTARRLATEHGIALELVHGNAEQVPKPDASFDFAISEYGAAIWCDPELWVREAHRLLRPGGQLHFLGNSPWAMVCAPESGEPATWRLERSYFDLGRIDWRDCAVDPGGIEFNLAISEWFQLFREVGFDVLDYREPRVAEGRRGARYFASAAWGRHFPTEQIWKLRKRAAPIDAGPSFP